MFPKQFTDMRKALMSGHDFHASPPWNARSPLRICHTRWRSSRSRAKQAKRAKPQSVSRGCPVTAPTAKKWVGHVWGGSMSLSKWSVSRCWDRLPCVLFRHRQPWGSSGSCNHGSALLAGGGWSPWFLVSYLYCSIVW